MPKRLEISVGHYAPDQQVKPRILLGDRAAKG
jgi:hypothetical protein